MHENEKNMKAWELTRDLLRDTKPVVRTAEEQTWDASAVMKAQDDLMAMFWKSNVPGSAAPECLMAGALQSLENKGYVLEPYAELLRDGLAALERGDFETLYRIDMRLRVLMRAAQPDPNHISQKTVRYTAWEQFDAAVQWPEDVLLWAQRLERHSKAIRLKTSWRFSARSAIMCANRTPIMTTSPLKSPFWKPLATRVPPSPAAILPNAGLH
jgi:hypothetical protein